MDKFEWDRRNNWNRIDFLEKFKNLFKGGSFPTIDIYKTINGKEKKIMELKFKEWRWE